MDTLEVLALLQDVAEQVINPRFRTLRGSQVSEKNPGDLVTVADHEAEVLITRALRSAYPDAVVLGEEAHAADGALLDRFRRGGHAFTVDPVDGTRNFVHGSPDHAVMVAEVRDSRVVRSWIWQPQHGTAYVAERGGGAWRHGPGGSRTRLVREPVAATSTPRGVTSHRRWVGRDLGGLGTLDLTWVCCGVDYPQLVEGAADFILYRGRQPWDHAPGALLLEEAGAVVGGFDGRPYRPQVLPEGGLVGASDPTVYDRVVAALPQLRRR